MKHINVLEPNIANKIAAGEVVERPASIVKELLENSLDAGATAITVEIRGGGVDYIRVTDNGAGIPEEDVPTAFLRHATSKLTTVEDLENIESFGFRGEALASIAAVSKVVMRTRTQESDCGTRISVEGGVQTALEPCACPAGTTIEVNELFYNVPARLKFIKNARTEAAAITDYVSRLMLANPDISIKLLNTGRTALQTNGGGDLAGTILSVYGSSVFTSLYRVDHDDGYMRITGYVGGESIARSNRMQQSVFVNHRYIRSALISNAVQRAFLTRLMNHRFPFLVLNITISSREVDVNVHPNKLSVRFKDEERIANTVARAITNALAGNPVSIMNGMDAISGTIRPEVKPSFYSETERKHEPDVEKEVRDIFKNGGTGTGFRFPADHSEKEEFEALDTAVQAQPTVKPSDFSLGDSGTFSIPDFKPQPKPVYSDPFAKTDRGREEAFGSVPVFHVGGEEKPKFAEKPEQLSLDTDTCRIIGTAFDTYIIVQQGEAIYYIDQHAAHERMLYEKLISGKLKFDSQLLAVPIIMPLDPVSFNCVSENIERFEEFGYSIDVSNEPTLKVDAVPNLPDARAERFLRDVIDAVIENKDAREADVVRSRIIKMSCKRAVKAGDSLDIRQLKSIVDAYTGGDVPLTCPHGRPVLIRVSKNDLQKMFKRII